MRTFKASHRGLKVFVYYNLHKHCWSVKALEGREKGRVLCHGTPVVLDHVTPKVSQKGRERVLQEQKKNVHAGLVGRLANVTDLAMADYMLGTTCPQITYNPYKYKTFVDKATETPYTGSTTVLMTERNVFVTQA